MSDRNDVNSHDKSDGDPCQIGVGYNSETHRKLGIDGLQKYSIQFAQMDRFGKKIKISRKKHMEKTSDDDVI